MTPYNESAFLSKRFGEDIILEDAEEQEEHYRIVTEMEVASKRYAILQLHGDPEEDAYLFRVLPDGASITVENVTDDDEWEQVTEACRQWMHCDRP